MWSEPGALEAFRTIGLTYADQLRGRACPASDVSLLRLIEVTGHAEPRSQRMPPLELGYSAFDPQCRGYQTIRARRDDVPPASLADPSFDLFGDALPGILQLGSVARDWCILGDGPLDRPRRSRRAERPPRGDGLSR